MSSPTTTTPTTPGPATTTTSMPGEIRFEQVAELKRKDLQTELKRRRLPALGSDVEMRRRLQMYLRRPGRQSSSPAQSPPDDGATTLGAGAQPDVGAAGSAATVPTVTVPLTALTPADSSAEEEAASSAPAPGISAAAAAGFTGPRGTGFDGANDEDDEVDEEESAASAAHGESLSESDDDDDDEDKDESAASASTGPGGSKKKKKKKQAKKKKQKNFTANEMVRLAHVMIDPAVATAVAAIASGKNREQHDAKYDGWEDVAELFNDFLDNYFEHPCFDEDSVYIGTPTIRLHSLDPNEHREERSAKTLKKKWVELKGWLTRYFEMWNASGQMTPADPESAKSITCFLRKDDINKQEHPHEKVIKYVHLLYKGDPDHMDFVSKMVTGGGRESGSKKRGAAGGGNASNKQRRVEHDLTGAMETSSESDKRAAAAFESAASAEHRAADARQAIAAAELLKQLATAPSALQPLIEARISKLLGEPSGLPPPAPAAAAAADATAAAAATAQ